MHDQRRLLLTALEVVLARRFVLRERQALAARVGGAPSLRLDCAEAGARVDHLQIVAGLEGATVVQEARGVRVLRGVARDNELTRAPRPCAARPGKT